MVKFLDLHKVNEHFRAEMDAFDAFLGRMEVFDFNELATHWCRSLYGKWSWTAVSFACERHPWKTPWLVFGWMLKGCR